MARYENYIFKKIVRIVIGSSIRSSAELVKLLGMKSSKQWDIVDCYSSHERKYLTPIKEPMNTVIYDSEVDSIRLEEHYAVLLPRFNDKLKVLDLLAKEGAEIVLSIVIYCKDEPILSFEKEEVKMLSQMKASVDIDLHLWRQEDDWLEWLEGECDCEECRSKHP